MGLGSYADLKAEVISWAAGSSDPGMNNAIDSAIQMAEQGMNLGLRLPEMLKRAKLVLSDPTGFLTLPDDFLDLKEAFIMDRSGQVYQLHGSASYTAYTPGIGYSLAGRQIILRPIPGDIASNPWTVSIWYYGTVEPLNDSTVCTAILAKYPSLYLYAVLGHLGQWLDADEARTQQWKEAAQAAFSAAQVAAVGRESVIAGPW